MLKNKSAKKKVNKELLRRPDVYVTALSSKNELKLARSATTGEKFDTLDERIDCEVDRLNKKIDVSMLQQEDKESHAIENSIEGSTTDMVIKGRTLINMVKLGSVSNVIGIAYDTLAIYSYMYNLKNDTDYTIIFEIENKTDNNQVRISLNNGNKGQGFDVKNGINIIKIRSDAEKNNKLMFYYGSEYSGNGTVKNVILLEGDWTNKPIPQYFEGIKSFGQQEDKISILSSGKNRCDGSTLDAFINGNGVIQADRTALSYIAKVFKGGEYSLNKTGGDRRWIGYFTEYPKIGDTAKIYNGGGKITIPDKGYIVAYVSSDKNIVPVNNVIVSEGSVPSEYTIYKEDKKDILLQDLGFDEGIRGIKNITDELNSIRSVAIKRIGKREYREGDLLLDNVITDKVNTYYVLEEPIETPLDENIILKTFGEKTYVSFENAISGTSSFKAPVNAAATISRLNRENRALEEENKTLRQDFESTTLSLTDSDLELVKQNVDMDFRLMEVEFALDIPQSTLSSNINFKKKGEVKSMARTPCEMMKIVILSGDYDREDYIHKVGKYYERGRMTKEAHDELMSLMTADEVISK
ncbi:TPA: hypothetical protein ACF2DD_001997 [Clostridium perfringens]